MKKRFGALSASASPVLRVGGHDARLLGAVTVAGRWRGDELKPEAARRATMALRPYRRRARRRPVPEPRRARPRARSWSALARKITLGHEPVRPEPESDDPARLRMRGQAL